MKTTNFIIEEKTSLIASCIVVSLLGFFIHMTQNNKIDLNKFFIWLPISWLMVFILGFSFKLFLGDKK